LITDEQGPFYQHAVGTEQFQDLVILQVRQLFLEGQASVYLAAGIEKFLTVLTTLSDDGFKFSFVGSLSLYVPIAIGNAVAFQIRNGTLAG